MKIRTLVLTLGLTLLLAGVAGCNDEQSEGDQAQQEGKSWWKQAKETGLEAIGAAREKGKDEFVRTVSEKLDDLQQRANRRMDQWQDQADDANQETQREFRDARETFEDRLAQARRELDRVRRSDEWKQIAEAAQNAYRQAMSAMEELAAEAEDLPER